MFPFIEKRILEEIAAADTSPDVKFIVLDGAILLETGWHRHCDKIVFVDTPRDVRLARLQEKRGWDEQELSRRIESVQMPLEEKKKRADVVLVNDSDFEKVYRQAKDALERLQQYI